ncbi:MAG: DUF6165 family protein [Cyanobium sp.]
MADLLIPVSVGELIDKITILELKRACLQGAALEHVLRELSALEGVLATASLQPEPELLQQLRQVNAELWRIEDDIREQERLQEFGERFVALARSVYRTNDRRAALKRALNDHHGSALIEEKAYRPY